MAEAELELQEQDAADRWVDEIRVDHFLYRLRWQVGQIKAAVLITEAQAREQARKWLVVIEIFPGHDEGVDPSVNIEPRKPMRLQQSPVQTSAGHVGHIVNAIAKAIGHDDFLPSRCRFELVLETQTKIILVPIVAGIKVV